MFDFLRNAFALDSEKDSVAVQQIPKERQKELIETLAKAIVERGLSAPAILFLESVKPMNFLGSQAMLFLEPIIKVVFPYKSYSEVAILLENRGCIEQLILKLEKLAVKSPDLPEKEEKRR